MQLYLRDPAGNLVELDAVGASRLPGGHAARSIRCSTDRQPQSGEHADARLYIGADLVR